jgi:nucleoside-diphosphate-sugar epimerase
MKNFNEETKTEPSEGYGPICKGKILAESQIWDIFERRNYQEQVMNVVIPGVLFGPVLSNIDSPSIRYVKETLEGRFPAVPDLYLPTVDVRDVADALIRVLPK